MRTSIVGVILFSLAAAPVPGPTVLVPGHPISVVSSQIFFPGPSGLAWNPAGGLYVATGGAESTYKTPVITLALDGTYTTFGSAVRDPDDVAIDPNGTLYVGTRNGVYKITPDGTTTVLAIDPANVGKKFPTVGVLWQADYLALNPVTGDLYCSGSFGKILKINTTTGAYTTVADQVNGGLAFLPDGTLYCGDRMSKRLLRIHPDGVLETVVDCSSLPYAPVSIAFHAPT